MATKVIGPLTFELMVRKVEGVDRDLPDAPRGFKTIRGDWPTVTRRANELNALQKRIQKPMYFFYPETVPADWNRTHCDVCKRIAAREAL